MISPILAGLAVGIGVPILLFYVYGVVPVSLCRSGGCGGSPSTDDSAIVTNRTADNSSIDAVSAKVANPSIGEASLSMASGSQVLREPDRESSSTVALAGSTAGHRLEVQADLASAQRFSISSLTESTGDDGGASTRALAGSMLNYKSNGSDSCSCVTTEDCASERVRFDDNVSFIASQAEKTSIGSSCSFRARCTTKPTLARSERVASDAMSNDSIYIDMAAVDDKPRKSQAAILRSQFFYSGMSDTKSLDDKTIIEVSNETLDKQALIQGDDTAKMKKSGSFVVESSKL
ncbi:E3 ubiquitin-protein ligase RNF19A-like Protein [Tribolium castaneum]|uniref:E3 ubiquitin-protein ligase RNF19A-like Protein n=3 Tax=Tribolium castaneum TaxID=7070 RepID=A0A139WAJ9_TRICA|nr:E3 ubiquitin-protein ligase RNF19A-like Protein [Tribolium castaneum]